MAGNALTLADEKLPAGGRITGNASFCRHRVPRGDHCRESVDRVGREVESGHPGGGDAISNDITQALTGSRANRRISGKSRALLCATGIVSMASTAKFRIRLLDIGRILCPQHRAQENGDQDGAGFGDLESHNQAPAGRGTISSGMPSPGPPMSAVRMYPSAIVKMPGKRCRHGSFAAGTYCRALASMPATAGTRA